MARPGNLIGSCEFCIAISIEAFEAITRTLPLGGVAGDAEANERASAWVDRLGAMRGAGASESYGDVIL